jgi:hypothetical protein
MGDHTVKIPLIKSAAFSLIMDVAQTDHETHYDWDGRLKE